MVKSSRAKSLKMRALHETCSWREAMILSSAEVDNLSANTWFRNTCRREFSHSFSVQSSEFADI